MSEEATREIAANGEVGTSKGISAFEALRQEVEERAAEEALLLPIPGWEGKLVARYTVVPREQITPLIKRVQRNGVDSLSQDADIDLLCRALDSLYVVGDDDKRIRLDDPETGEPMRFDGRLGALLPQAPAEAGARGVVRALFRDNTIALGTHIARVVEWMQDTSAEVEGAISEGE